MIPQNRKPSVPANSSEQDIQMSNLGVEQDVRVRNGSVSPDNRTLESFEEGGETSFHLRKEQPNSQDPERRAKEFKGRHIQMMALGILLKNHIDLGSAIGAGLLFQSGKALYDGGPVSLWLAYLLMGTVSYSVLV